jgi:hypothetical protein
VLVEIVPGTTLLGNDSFGFIHSHTDTHTVL